LVSIPAWEQEAGRPFLVHGESIMPVLMATVSAGDQENKRKQPRAGSVPLRATTPVNSSHGYVPGVKTGVVTPAVRTSSHMASQSVPNKRQRLGENNSSATPTYSSGARAPFGAYRGGNAPSGIARPVSPTKIPSKTPCGEGSSLPRPAALAMVMPKAGTQHHALGHGRIPSTVIYGAGVTGVNAYSSGTRSTSSTSTAPGYGRALSGAYSKSNAVSGSHQLKKATRARRESFKPRPSMDSTLDLAVSVGVSGGRWGGGYTVREEDEY
jgi:protein regulator of cytokinesis 1